MRTGNMMMLRYSVTTLKFDGLLIVKLGVIFGYIKGVDLVELVLLLLEVLTVDCGLADC